jgi:pullulanase/glycogen debranching enzyme
LLFFDNESDARPSRVIPIDPAANRTYHYWHVFVPGVERGQIYGYRVQGASDPSKGTRFDPTKVLLDAYGRGVVVPWHYNRDSARQVGDNAATAMKSLVVAVFQFDAQDCPPGLVNYWGYSPVSFFAPDQAYSLRRDRLGPMDEFRDMVKALHRAGIEVILDVVFNHSAEGDHNGPTLCFRGLDNSTYYILEHDRSRYANYRGTGNTLNPNHPIVRRMILDSLRHWVKEMHVDGFRFDLASILSPRVRAGNAEPAGALGYRIGSGTRGDKAHRGGVGRGGSVSSGQLHRGQLEGVERSVSR